MKERMFRFKQFSVVHSRSAMPVGVDGVLIGAWASAGGERILDAGCGCGLIALMLAQRNSSALVTGIDCHLPSVEESASNFAESPWSRRLEARLCIFPEEVSGIDKFDGIVSNPPFFHAGIGAVDSARLKARHAGALSAKSLIEHAPEMLNPDGYLSVIVPAEEYGSLVARAAASGLNVARWCFVKDHESAPEKRVMLEFRYYPEAIPDTDGILAADTSANREPEGETLTMFESDGSPTGQYRRLCGPFYLKF